MTATAQVLNVHSPSYQAPICGVGTVCLERKDFTRNAPHLGPVSFPALASGCRAEERREGGSIHFNAATAGNEVSAG